MMELTGISLCMCSRELRLFYNWNESLRISIDVATLFEESEARDNLTELTDINLVTSLATLSMLASAKVVKDISADCKVYAIRAENFEGQLKARDHSINNLRRTLAEATGDSNESFR